jgi:hypothetical protein
MFRRVYGLSLLLVLLITGCGTTQPATIWYRETMQFHCYDPDFADSNPQGCFALASYYTITCIDNRGPNTIDFTLDMTKMNNPDSVTGQRNGAATKDTPILASTGPNWKNSFLSAAPFVVPHGQRVQPPQPFSFVVSFPGSTDADHGPHSLNYDSIQSAPVLISRDVSVPSPIWGQGAATNDFKRGFFTFVGERQPPPANCPPN